jgi:hypothetical protein
MNSDDKFESPSPHPLPKIKISQDKMFFDRSTETKSRARSFSKGAVGSRRGANPEMGTQLLEIKKDITAQFSKLNNTK